MVRSKLEEHKLRDVPLRDLEPGKIEQAGPFGIEMIHMSHSIPDARAVALHTELGHDPLHRRLQVRPDPGRRPARPTSPASPSSARRACCCLCGDSTNADRPGVAPSESSVGPALLETFSRCEGRIIVTCFASNVHRVQQVIDAAAQLDRKVALVGRSMRKNFNIASNLGIANAPDGLLIQPREIEDLPDEQGDRDLDRQPGRAALGAAADGARRPPRRRAALGRHGRLQRHADPRQRALGQRDGRPDLRDRRPGDHRRRRPDPRLRPRLARRR